MSVDRIYYCEGPDCEAHAQTATPPPYLPISFIETRRRDPEGEEVHHFCGWDCLLKYAAAQPLPERIDG